MKKLYSSIILIMIASMLIAGCDRVESDWKKAAQSNTAAAYGEFLAKHPKSAHVNEAKKLIDDLDWQDAKTKNSIDAFANYLNKHPEGQYVSDATKMKEEAGMSTIEGKLTASMMLGGPIIITVKVQNTLYQIFRNSKTKFENIKTDGGAVQWELGRMHRIKGTVSEKLPPEFRNSPRDSRASRFIVAREITLIK